MKSITRYVCERCGIEYNNPAAAIECETRHPKIAHVQEKYSKSANFAIYPYKVEITFEDGKKRQYVAEDAFHVPH